MTTTRDYYDILGIPRDADEKAIKKAFRLLAREHHPDVNDSPESEEEFKDIAAAYEVLCDPERRALYDRYGHEGLRNAGAEPDFSGFHDLSSIFEAFFGAGGGGGIFGGFGGAGAARGPAQGGDVAVAVDLTLAEVITDREVSVDFEVIETCQKCHGNQAEPGTPIVTCKKCDGAGRLRTATRTVLGTIERVMACDVCEGSGKTFETACSDCQGKGRVRAGRAVTVDIPAGIADGQQVRVTGRGHAGALGGPPGDLYVVARVAEDERFHREGTELFTIVEISIHEAALGATVEIDTLEGTEPLDIAPGTGHGDELLLRGHGLPAVRGRSRGDIHAVVNLTVPQNLTDKQRELLERFGETITEDNLREQGRGSLLSRLRRALG